MWVNTNISGILWPSTAAFQAVSHLSKISAWVAAEKHNAPYPGVNPSFVKSMTKLPLTSMGSQPVMSDFHSGLGLGVSCRKTTQTSTQGVEEHYGFADLSPLWLKMVYCPLNPDVSKEEMTVLLLRSYCFLSLYIFLREYYPGWFIQLEIVVSVGIFDMEWIGECYHMLCSPWIKVKWKPGGVKLAVTVKLWVRKKT